MEWVATTTKAITTYPRHLLGALGSVLVGLSFFNAGLAGGHLEFSALSVPRWPMFVCGAVFLAPSAVGWALSLGGSRRWSARHLRDGVVCGGPANITIRAGSIQDLSVVTRTTGIVLPVNTTFSDDCLTDPRSALGSFALAHFPEKQTEFRATVLGALPEPVSRDAAHGGQWPPGTTVVVPGSYGAPATLLLTAATVRTSDAGINATPSSIARCIEEVLLATRDRKIDHLRIPLIGAGHGGVTAVHAVSAIVLAIEHATRRMHHVKRFEVVVRQEDAARLVQELEKGQTAMHIKRST